MDMIHYIVPCWNGPILNSVTVQFSHYMTWSYFSEAWTKSHYVLESDFNILCLNFPLHQCYYSITSVFFHICISQAEERQFFLWAYVEVHRLDSKTAGVTIVFGYFWNDSAVLNESFEWVVKLISH